VSGECKNSHSPLTTHHSPLLKIMLAISLMRMGSKGKPFYRVVVKEKRSKRDGKYLENVGTYNPMMNPAEVNLKHERINYWISVGAQPTDTVRSLIKHNPEQTEEERAASVEARKAKAEAEKQAKIEARRAEEEAKLKAEEERIAAEKAAADAEAKAAADAAAAEQAEAEAQAAAEAAQAEAPAEETTEAEAAAPATETAEEVTAEAAETTEGTEAAVATEEEKSSE
jgi:small subunit ribosomal protein S16